MNMHSAIKPSMMTEQQFNAVFGLVYENSPWVIAEAFRLGMTGAHDDEENLAGLMASVVNQASRDAKLDLLRAHPDLAGRLAQRGEMTAASVEEQSSAGLNQCSKEEFARFHELNERYKNKFEFPFIIAVRGLQRSEVLDTFERRTKNNAEDEFAEAIMQVNRIASLRIKAVLSSLT